jgi:DNA-directed RNA polymerase subunit RPC12/RpoP
MAKIILAVLVSAFMTYGFNTTLATASSSETQDGLIKCTTCGAEFTSIPLAEQHLKEQKNHEITESAQPLVKCSTCGVEFTSEAGLKKHLQTKDQHPDTPLIKCSTCGVEFTSPSLWKEHLKTHPAHEAI